MEMSNRKENIPKKKPNSKPNQQNKGRKGKDVLWQRRGSDAAGCSGSTVAGKQQQKHCDHHAAATAALRPALGARGRWTVVAFAHAISVLLGRRDGKPPERKTLNRGLSWKGVDS